MKGDEQGFLAKIGELFEALSQGAGAEGKFGLIIAIAIILLILLVTGIIKFFGSYFD